jgi:hypothetical protein
VKRADFHGYVYPPHSTRDSVSFMVSGGPPPVVGGPGAPKPYHCIAMRVEGQWLCAERDGKTCRYPLSAVSRIED